MTVAGLPTPEGHAPTAARSICAEYADQALFNHSVRSYFWAAEYARTHSLDYDAELLYVAALLHDLGLTAPFDSHTLPFEEAGGHLANVFTAGLGWPEDRRNRARHIIIQHMREDVSPTEDVESHLLQVGTSADVSGLRLPDFTPTFTKTLMTHYPRLSFGPDFLSHMQSQATRKPTCAAATLIQGGVATRIAANPLEPH
ncbi:HD domain-containing protein [Nocardia huaxiensis]|uniref:HD domain-containing protein n=1 Tax=Nocardia huaxiensis TaxID=2755382 RepID=A0A7D6ZJP7_9NOCA|nr:HD domain-containing protein [Nocardia huaxiensis]QLY32287.1 HD domain-containing protein [Nocardia huaxiensis]UFS94008.1 HD domain-containing protein [Nocardia huaxiensis]